MANLIEITDQRSGEKIILDVRTYSNKGISLTYGTEDLLTFTLEDPENVKALIQFLQIAAAGCWPGIQFNQNDQISPDLDRALGGRSKYPRI